MKKNLTILIAMLIIVFALTGCGEKKESKDLTVDITKLCDDLQGTITSDLNVVNSDILSSTYFIDLSKVDDSIAALNSGASACEVAVIKCKDSAYAGEVKKLFENRIKSQSDLFASYNAPEVAKLDSAVLKTAGNYVVFCVTDDTKKAEEIVKEAGF